MRRQPTSLSRSASGCAFTKSLMFPFTIHSDTISNRASVIVTPISGNTFGCRRFFHATTSLQRICEGPGQRIGMWKERTNCDPRRLSSASHRLSTFSEPLLQRPDRSVPPSTRPQTCRCTMRRPFGHNKRGSLRFSEGAHGGHIFCTTT